MERKQVSPWYLKAPAEGVVVARFATLGVPDLDFDVIEPGAIGEQQVQVSAFGHESWNGALPVGRGRTYEKGQKEAIATLQFFTNTTHGSDAFETVKGLGELGRWSFGFTVEEQAEPDEAQRALGVLRVLKRLKIHEISPVLRAAGVGTATLSAKCNGCGIAVAPRQARGNLSPTSVFHAAEAAVAAAGELLNGSGPEDTEVGELARFAAYCGHLLNGCPGRILEPAIKWFDADFMPGAAGWMLPKTHDTWLLRGLSGEALVRTVLHEAKHHEQSDPRSPGAEAEAAAFAAKWTGPVWAAWRWSNGQAHRVRVTGDRWPPFRGKSRHGDVVLQKAGARAWAYNTRAVTGPWLGIG